MTSPTRLAFDQVLARTASALMAAGASAVAARATARALVFAEADGHAGHGLVRLAGYTAQLRAGKIRGRAEPALTHSRAAAAAVDACNGFAYPALDLAIDWLIRVAPVQGIAAVGVRRSGHCGAMGLVVEQIARHGLTGFMVANTPAAMAPWGGRRPLLGTNPIACAMPYADDPVVIDLSLSKVARGHVLAAQLHGEPIPEGWALDADGAPTTSADSALRGTMVPLGAAKGAALALMVEALAAGLTGSSYAFDASSFLDEQGPPPGTGQFLLAIDPSACGGGIDHLAKLFAEIAGEDGARLPGVSRFARRRAAQAEGLLVEPGWLAA